MSLKITSLNCKILLLSVTMLLKTGILSAQNNQFQFLHLDIGNGLSHNNVTSILKDKLLEHPNLKSKWVVFIVA